MEVEVSEADTPLTPSPLKRGGERYWNTEGKAIEGRVSRENRTLSGNPEVKDELGKQVQSLRTPKQDLS